MSNTQTVPVVATFADTAAAQRAVDTLTRSGIPSADVHLHEKGMRPRSASGVMLDEYATGGFFTSVGHLLDDLMGIPRRSPSYEDLVQFEGVAVSVRTDKGSEQVERIEALLRDAGAQKVGSGRGLDGP